MILTLFTNYLTYLSSDIFFQIHRSFVVSKLLQIEFTQRNATLFGNIYCEFWMWTPSKNSQIRTIFSFVKFIVILGWHVDVLGYPTSFLWQVAISQKSSKFSRNSKHVNKSSFKLNWCWLHWVSWVPIFYGTACKLQHHGGHWVHPGL